MSNHEYYNPQLLFVQHPFFLLPESPEIQSYSYIDFPFSFHRIEVSHSISS